MSDVTAILNAIDAGDASATHQLLPVVYEELRSMAAAQMVRESPGQTLQPTALVHEAYLRLTGAAGQSTWGSRGHFFAAAAEAMRRILIESARRRNAIKRGGDLQRAEFDLNEFAGRAASNEILAVDEALERFARVAPAKAELVKLRYFAGFTLVEAADLLGISPREADRWWAYAKSWLKLALQDPDPAGRK
jgi:RNA polymerase sigma factor (TIGR02999 family)